MKFRARTLSLFMADSIASQRVVSLSSIDEPNLGPIFNSYAWSSSLAWEAFNDKLHENNDCVLPCLSNEAFRKDFPQAGILLDRGVDHYTVVNYKKGGVVQHYLNNQQSRIDTGVVIESAREKLASSQHYDVHAKIEIKDSVITIQNQVAEMPKRLPTPFQFLVLRMLCFSVFRFSTIRNSSKEPWLNFSLQSRSYGPYLTLEKLSLGVI